MFKSFLVICTLIFTFVYCAAAQGYVWTYQGKLTDGGFPANGVYDIRITQLEAIDQPIGTDTIFEDVQVVKGVFSVNVTTGALILIENRLRFIEIAVRPGTSTDAFTILSPRQPVNMAPYAGRAATAGEANYAVNATNVSGGTVSGNGAGLTNISGASISAGTIGIEQLAPNLLDAPKHNASLLASKRWDILKSTKAFVVGNSPSGIAFDGRYIWTSNYGSNNVTKLDPADGSIVGTYPVGVNPWGMAFDGTNIWVANNNGNSVTKIRASDGSHQGTFAVGENPISVAFDGTNIWVTNNTSGGMTALRASDGTNLGTVGTGIGPVANVFDGNNIWTANLGNVTKIRSSDGISFGSYSLGAYGNGVAIEFDGSHIYVATHLGNVVKIRPIDGSIISSFPTSSKGLLPRDLLFDGANLWVTHGDGSVYKFRTSDGSNLARFTVTAATRGLIFDGSYVWATVPGMNWAVRVSPVFPNP